MIMSGIKRISTLRMSFFSNALCHSTSLASKARKNGFSEGLSTRTSVLVTLPSSAGGLTSYFSSTRTVFGAGFDISAEVLSQQTSENTQKAKRGLSYIYGLVTLSGILHVSTCSVGTSVNCTRGVVHDYHRMTVPSVLTKVPRTQQEVPSTSSRVDEIILREAEMGKGRSPMGCTRLPRSGVRYTRRGTWSRRQIWEPFKAEASRNGQV